MEKYKKRVQRILAGNLSKVLKRDITKLGEKQGTKVYLYVDEVAYKKLISDTNMNDFLMDNGIVMTSTPDKSVQPEPDKSVQPEQDKSVQSDSSTNDSSTNDSSITTQSEDKPLVVETNKELIESKTHLLLDSKNKRDKVSKWDKDRLVESIEIFIKENGEYFSFLEKIYKDDKNFAPKKANEVKQVKTRFHNISDHTKKYTPEELEKLLKENQARKQAKKLEELANKNNQETTGPVEITNELINTCRIDPAYFNSLDTDAKNAIKNYMSEYCQFIPLHIRNI